MESEIQNPSTNYEQQLEEIEILKNILPEKIKILKSEPNFDIQIEIEGDNPEQDKPFKTFFLEVFLNNYYPEKSPRIQFYEANDCLNEKKKETLIKKLEQYCQENIGMPVIYQLYEIVKEFADEEEKISLIQKKEKMKGKIIYTLSNLNKIKQIKIKESYPIDIFNIKNGNVLIIYKNGLINVYDNQFQNLIFESLKEETELPIIFSKYFDFSTMLYLFNCHELLIYELCFLNKKKVMEDYKYKINGNIQIKFLYKLKSKDVIEFPQYPKSFFVIIKDEDKYSLDEYSKQSFECISKREFDNPFYKLIYINPDKFFKACYTLKNKEGDIIGINEMCLIDSNTFEKRKEYKIKISPLNNSVQTFKNEYLIFSYFSTIKEGEKNEKDPYYNFNDYFYIDIFHDVNNFFDNYEDDYINTHKDYIHLFYTYDIKQHCIGIYSIKYEEFTTKIEFDLIKCIYNIKDNILCEFVKKGNTNKKTQISYESNFHEYYNDIPLEESNEAEDYKTKKYLAYLILDNGVNTLEGNFDYDNITCFKEINNNYLVICSEKKGIVLYK